MKDFTIAPLSEERKKEVIEFVKSLYLFGKEYYEEVKKEYATCQMMYDFGRVTHYDLGLKTERRRFLNLDNHF